MFRPTRTSRTVIAGCFVCNGMEAMWFAGNAQGVAAANTSGFKGVTWSKRDRRWYARIKHQGKSRHIGLYDTAEEAAAAYAVEAALLHGEFANTGAGR